MEAVILAGGKGTRLRDITGDEIPKPMVELLGKPLLERQIEQLARSGFDSIHLIVGHLHEVIEEYFGDGSAFGVHIDYIVENEPLGTAGGLYYLKGSMNEDFALVFGDLAFDLDWSRFFDFHKAEGASITLFVHPNSHPADSDIVLTDGSQRVTGLLPKNEERDIWYRNIVNAGLYIVSPVVLDSINEPMKIDLEKDLLPNLIESGKAFAYRSSEYVKDAGTPDRLAAVANDIEIGVPHKKNLKQPQRAIFLDRDGTINVYKGFLRNVEDFELEEGAAQGISKLNASGYLCIVVTNQPVLARGECSRDTLDEIHARMETLLGIEGAFLDAVLYCPHHPDSGFDGEVPELKLRCECRKPNIGMIASARESFNIDLANSWTVGDTTVDIQTGLNAGTKTALVTTGEAGRDGKFQVCPDRVFATLKEFADYLCRGGE